MKIHFTVNKNLFRKLCVVFPALIQDLVKFMTKKKKKEMEEERQMFQGYLVVYIFISKKSNQIIQ
jgi:hypothetical protein